LRAASKAAQPAMTRSAPATMAAAIASSKGSKAEISVHVSHATVTTNVCLCKLSYGGRQDSTLRQHRHERSARYRPTAEMLGFFSMHLVGSSSR
jgi:hypothetical protein